MAIPHAYYGYTMARRDIQRGRAHARTPYYALFFSCNMVVFWAGRGVRAGGGAAWPRGGGAGPVAAAVCGTDRQAAATKYRAI